MLPKRPLAVLISLFAFLFLYPVQLPAQQPGSTTILHWPEGKEAAVSLTFDDNLRSQLDVAIPEMERRGFRGTFFVVAQWLDDFAISEGLAPRWREVFRSGHEIGSHSYSHRYLTWLSDEELDFQIRGSKEIIERWIGEGNCRIFRHPWGDCDERTHRLVDLTYQWNSERLPSFIGGTVSGQRDPDVLREMIDQIIADRGWFISLFHGVGRDFMRIDADDFIEYLDYLDQNSDRIWVAPMTEVLRYATERSAVEVVSRDDGIRVMLPDTLDPVFYDHPLTLETRVPDSWDFARLTQSGRQRILPVSEDETGGYIRHEFMPGSEPVHVQRAGMNIEQQAEFDKAVTFSFEHKDELNDWQAVEGTWTLEEGVLASGEGEWTCKLLLSETLDDFQVDGRFKVLSGGETQSSFSYSGLYIRAEECLPGENNGIYYELDNHSSISDFRSNRVVLWHQWTPRDAEETPWYWPDSAVATFPASIGVDEWHSFRLIVRGGEMLYFLDGSPVLSYDDVEIPRGRFGLMSRGSRVLFDDIELATIQ